MPSFDGGDDDDDDDRVAPNYDWQFSAVVVAAAAKLKLSHHIHTQSIAPFDDDELLLRQQ